MEIHQIKIIICRLKSKNYVNLKIVITPMFEFFSSWDDVIDIMNELIYNYIIYANTKCMCIIILSIYVLK